MTKNISPTLLLRLLKSVWWIMLVAAIVVGSVVAAFTEFGISKKYQSSVEFYVINTSTTSEYVTASLLASAEYLTKDYVQIIKSDQVINAIMEELDAKGYDITKISASHIKDMISSSISQSSSMFTVTATSTDTEMSYAVATAIKDRAPAIIREITRPSYKSNLYTYTDSNRDGQPSINEFKKLDESDLECVVAIRAPRMATSHSSPNVVSYTIIAAFFSACLVYVLALFMRLSDTTIRNQRDIKNYIDPSVVVIGNIPTWSTHESEKNA